MREYLFYTLILILLSVVLFVGVYLTYLDNEKTFDKDEIKTQNQKIRIIDQESSKNNIIIIINGNLVEL